MTTADFICALLRLNIAASAATGLVFALRGPIRRRLGAQLAYGVWLLVPAAAAGALASGPAGGPASAILGAEKDWLSAGAHAGALLVLWALGVVALAAQAAWRQLRFMSAERSGRAGPAVVGVICPRIVVPRDFAARCPADERRLIRAHELAHIERRDARWTFVATVAAWACWFNPLASLALRAMRLDQEMACDATALEGRSACRRAYAETLLRTTPAEAGAPLVSSLVAQGCPLEMRVRAVMQPLAPQGLRDAGVAGLAGLCLVVCVGASALQPPYPTAWSMSFATSPIPSPVMQMRVYRLPDPGSRVAAMSTISRTGRRLAR